MGWETWTPGWTRELWDRVVASDPGLRRLRLAVTGAFSMATALGVEFVIFSIAGANAQNILIAMLLGAVVSMMGAMALTDPGRWAQVRTAIFFPVAVGLGVVIGILVDGNTDLMLGVFVAVMFAAVFVRRFGIAFFFYGFMTWMGYFFASFLHATMATMPSLMIAVVIGAAWVLLLSLTLLRPKPMRTLGRTIRAFDARARAVARAGAELIEHAVAGQGTERACRRLRFQQSRLADVALMVEGWSGEPGALPDGWSGPSLRRRLIDAHQTVDGLAAAAQALAEGDADLAVSALPVLDLLARHDDEGAARAAQLLAEKTGTGWWPARHLAVAALEFVELAGTAGAPPDVAEVDEFEPAVSLAMGNLPGSPAVAKEVHARGSRWNPLARVDLTTRQAVQVAFAGTLAILIGRELSPTRYYWAVIAAFIMFTGTATRSETFVKGFHRVLGTLTGLVASIWLANLTAGSTTMVIATIVASMFCGFYLLQLSYVYMIFFVTIMVGQMYSVLHIFSGELLVLRLEETAIGAAIGFVVAMIVLPLSTRDTVRSARDNLLTGLAELLDAAAAHLEGDSTAALDGLARVVDDRVRQLALVAKPLTRPLVWGNSPPRTRHRLTLYAATASHARALTAALRRNGCSRGRGAAAVACRSLAMAATELIAAPPGQPQPSAAEPLCVADTALFAGGTAPRELATDPVRQPLIHLHRVLREIAEPNEPIKPEVSPRMVSSSL